MKLERLGIAFAVVLSAAPARADDPPPLPPAPSENPWFQGPKSDETGREYARRLRDYIRRERDRAIREADARRDQALRERDRAENEAERAHAERDRARRRVPRVVPHPRVHKPKVKVHRWDYETSAHGDGRQRIILVPSRPNPPPDAVNERPAPPESRGGLTVAASASRSLGLVPLGDSLIAGARVQGAAPLGHNMAIGASGGIDTGSRGDVDAQVWHVGGLFAIGAPWTRDVVGFGVEAGILGAHYGSTTFGPNFYGLGRLTVQLPLAGDVRPFAAAELGVSERPDGSAAGIAGLSGGLVWNAW